MSHKSSMHTFALAAGMIALGTQAAPVRADTISYVSVNESVTSSGTGQLGGIPGSTVGYSTSNQTAGVYQSNLTTTGIIQTGLDNSTYTVGAYGSPNTFQNSNLASSGISSAVQLAPIALAYDGGRQSAGATDGVSSSLATNFMVDAVSLLNITGSDNITSVVAPPWGSEVYSVSEQFTLTDLTTGTTLFSASNSPAFSTAVTLNPNNVYSLNATLSESISITANGTGGNFQDQEATADLNFDASVTPPPAPVPEPGAIWLMLSGLCGLGIMAWQRRVGTQDIVGLSVA